MSLSLFCCEQLEPLFAHLRVRLRRERCTLPPQKTQVIVVGNLETEAFLTRQFVADDGILMGIDFPFLESAITDLCVRLKTAQIPHANESWFLPASALGTEHRPLGQVDLEILLLKLLQNPEGSELMQQLGLNVTTLPPTQLVTLAGNLAYELRESILHCPQSFASLAEKKNKTLTTAEKLWLHLETMLRSLARPFPSFDPKLPEWICSQNLPSDTVSETLYLFGMPIVSEYHVRNLVAIAHLFSVELYMVNLSGYAESNNQLLAKAGGKMRAFTQLLQRTCENYGTEFSAITLEPQSIHGRTLTICALPGIWRAAELMGDAFHAQLRENQNLPQNAIGVSLTDPTTQFAAFERALGMRQLTPFAREKFYQAPDVLAELWQIIAEVTQSGVSRALVARYALNPLVAQRYEDEPEKIPLYLSLLERAHGYRDDYSDTQSVFLIAEALRRIERSMLIGESYDPDLPASLRLGILDVHTLATELHTFLEPLLTAKIRFAELSGSKLADAMLQLQQEITPAMDAVEKLASWFDSIRELPGFSELSFAQVVKLMQRHLSGRSLSQQTNLEGITFASLGASCFIRHTHLLFDLCEDADRDDSGNRLFPEISKSPTRLAQREQLAIEIAQALTSNVHTLILAYSSHDPATGAQKYPAQVLADVSEAARIINRREIPAPSYPVTIMGTYDKIPPIAAAADHKTLWLLNNPQLPHEPLANFLLPELVTENNRTELDFHDLLDYLNDPAHYFLRDHLPNEPELVAFRREEPRLAVSSDAQLLFCEDYLKHALLDARGDTLIAATDFVRWRQKRGEYAPEGFDQSMRLLAENNNNSRLFALAQSLQNDFTLVEYVFRADVFSPFCVPESRRLIRIYLPSIKIHDTSIIGTSATLLRTHDKQYYRLMSAIYPNRNALLVELHLLLCLLALSGLTPRIDSIALADLGTKTRSADPISAIGFNPTAVLSTPSFQQSAQYLESILIAIKNPEPIFFDHSLINEKKLGQWAALTDEQLLIAFRKASENADNSTRSTSARDFFALEVTEKSVEFFKKFILPIAEIDWRENLQEKVKSKGDDKSKPKRANKKNDRKQKSLG